MLQGYTITSVLPWRSALAVQHVIPLTGITIAILQTHVCPDTGTVELNECEEVKQLDYRTTIVVANDGQDGEEAA